MPDIVSKITALLEKVMEELDSLYEQLENTISKHLRYNLKEEIHLLRIDRNILRSQLKQLRFQA